MPRRKTPLRAGECYHVYNRGVNRQLIFFERENYLFFLRKLRDLVVGGTCVPPIVPDTASVRDNAAPHADIIAYCVMPNHYHLLVMLHDDDFAAHMRRFGQSYSEAINRRNDRVGPLFEGRFHAIHVDRDEYLLHLSRYIHLNPVDAALVRQPQDWEFSSYRDYLGLRCGSLPRPDLVLRQFARWQASVPDTDSVRDAYRRFTESAIGKEDLAISHLTFDEQ